MLEAGSNALAFGHLTKVSVSNSATGGNHLSDSVVDHEILFLRMSPTG